MRRIALLLVTLLLAAIALTGCQSARVGARCSPSQGPARNDTHVLFCVKGRWKATVTFGQAADILLAGKPARLEAQGNVISPRRAVAGEAITSMGVRVLDRAGLGVGGAQVAFTGVARTVVTSDAAGVAALPMSVVSQVAGDWTVTAAVDGVAPVQLHLRILPAAPDHTYRSENLTQTVTVGDAIAPMTIDVVDRFGNPVPGVSAVADVAGVDGRLIEGFAAREDRGRLTITTEPLLATGTATLRLRIYEPTHTTVFTEIELSWTVVA